MNEQVQGYLAEILRRGISGLDTASSFVQAELPIFIKEFLTFKAIWHWSVVVIILIICIGLLAWLYPVYKWNQRVGEFNKGMPYALWGFLGGMPLSFLSIVLFQHFQLALMVTFAPRYFLLAELAKLIK